MSRMYTVKALNLYALQLFNSEGGGVGVGGIDT